MINVIKTNSENPDFQNLVKLLDKDLDIRYGDKQEFYSQFNKLNSIHHAIVAYQNEIAVACGAIKKYSDDAVEIKRMFVHPQHRGKGLGKLVLVSLENWARELNYSYCVLESGNKQPEAVSLYSQSGYLVIPNYGQYENDENSICMKKQIAHE